MINEQRFAIWPVFYQSNEIKYRVVCYENDKVVYEALFNDRKKAKQHVKECTKSE